MAELTEGLSSPGPQLGHRGQARGSPGLLPGMASLQVTVLIRNTNRAEGI